MITVSRVPDLEHNPYENAEDSLEKIEEDLEELMTEYFSRGAISRPGFAEQLLTVAQQYEEFAKYTERSNGE